MQQRCKNEKVLYIDLKTCRAGLEDYQIRGKGITSYVAMILASYVVIFLTSYLDYHPIARLTP